MKIANVTMDENEMPATVTVVMTLAEAAYLGKLTGEQTGTAAEKMMGQAGREACSDVYACLTGSLFNRFYEDGVNEAARGMR